MSNRLRSIQRETLLTFVFVLSVACSDTVGVAVSTTQQPVTSINQGELVHASVTIGDGLDLEESRIPLLVTYGGCSGGLVPQEIETIEVEETHGTVLIEVFVRLPPQPFPTTCPDNPTIKHSVELKSPLGSRTIEVTFEKQTFTLWPTDS